MKSIRIIIANIFCASGVAFKIVREFPCWGTHYYSLEARVGREKLIARIFYKGDKDSYLFLCENSAGYDKDSSMPVAAIFKKYGGRRSYGRIKNLSYLATKEGKYMSFRQLNGDDHAVRDSFYR